MISIIVPTCNEGANVRELLGHLRRRSGWHDIIIADASDDEYSQRTLSQINADDSVTILSGCERGRAVQMNTAAWQAQGDTLLFLHCDTWLPKGALERIREYRMRYRWGRFEVRLDAPGIPYRVIETMINLRSRLRRLATGDQAIFVSARLFREIGGYIEQPLMEDIALSGQLQKYPPALITQPVLTSARRWQNRGIVKTVLLMWKLRLYYWLGADPQRLCREYGDER